MAKITSLSLATSRSYKDAQDKRHTETEWHRIMRGDDYDGRLSGNYDGR